MFLFYSFAPVRLYLEFELAGNFEARWRREVSAMATPDQGIAGRKVGAVVEAERRT